MWLYTFSRETLNTEEAKSFNVDCAGVFTSYNFIPEKNFLLVKDYSLNKITLQLVQQAFRLPSYFSC